MPNWGNSYERNTLRRETQTTIALVSKHKAEVYKFALDVYHKWQFGNVAETIFEKKRAKTEPILREILPDIEQRLNSIEQNINSKNQEDWKNAVASCRTLISDVADVLNPPSKKGDKSQYINRLKDFVATKEESETRQKLLGSYIEDLKDRIEFVSNYTQGSAHQKRPTIEYSEDVVLMTYLLIADLLELKDTK